MVRELKGELAFVLLDMSMPGLSGLATFARLRELRPSIPVIFSSGANQQDLVLGLRVESAAFLQKPYDLGALVKALRGLLPDTER